MSLTLHLGVVDQLYATPPSSGKRRKKGAGRTVSIGDVAGWLEDKYGVMARFYDAHQEEIATALANDVEGSLETVLMGGPAELNFGTATATIETMFKDAISNQEFDRMGIPGVPTKASLRGVSHRFKHPYARRASRPSFRDTGTFQASMRSWID
jgi:hypothetical protein